MTCLYWNYLLKNGFLLESLALATTLALSPFLTYFEAYWYQVLLLMCMPCIETEAFRLSTTICNTLRNVLLGLSLLCYAMNVHKFS